MHFRTTGPRSKARTIGNMVAPISRASGGYFLFRVLQFCYVTQLKMIISDFIQNCGSSREVHGNRGREAIIAYSATTRSQQHAEKETFPVPAVKNAAFVPDVPQCFWILRNCWRSKQLRCLTGGYFESPFQCSCRSYRMKCVLVSGQVPTLPWVLVEGGCKIEARF